MRSILAMALFFTPLSFILAQSIQRADGAKTNAATRNQATPRDLAGVWKRSARPPDNARRYTKFELTLALPVQGLELTPWGEAKFKANKPNVGPNPVPIKDSNDPDLKCFPPGVPRVFLERAEPFEIIQSTGRVVLVYEYNHIAREIYVDGRKHSEDLVPTWMGDSIGRWEGNTLVVDTVGFNDQTWLDYSGHPHSDALHVVERFRRANHDTLQLDLTIEDPKAYTKAWGGRIIFDLKPDWSLGEMVCEDNGNFLDIQKMTETGK
jgi:hypothetical protein